MPASSTPWNLRRSPLDDHLAPLVKPHAASTRVHRVGKLLLLPRQDDFMLWTVVGDGLRSPALAGADIRIGVHITSIPFMSHPVKQSPAPQLPPLPYQRDYIGDASRFIIWLSSRQVGKSWAAALEAVIDCYRHGGSHWVILSAGERQALEFMEKVRQHARAIGLAVSGFTDEAVAGTIYKSAEVRLANGSRITALPANPDTARGYSAHIILDEFALHQDAEAIWRAVYPTITNPLRGELKARVQAIPTRVGKSLPIQ